MEKLDQRIIDLVSFITALTQRDPLLSHLLCQLLLLGHKAIPLRNVFRDLHHCLNCLRHGRLHVLQWRWHPDLRNGKDNVHLKQRPATVSHCLAGEKVALKTTFDCLQRLSCACKRNNEVARTEYLSSGIGVPAIRLEVFCFIQHKYSK